MPLLRATIVSFNATAWTASVRLDGSQAQSLDGVKVARGIPAGDLLAGRRALLDTGDHGDAADVVLAVVFT